MKRIIDKLTIKRRNLIFDEADMVKVLNTINQHDSIWNLLNRCISIGNCGWADRTKWFVHFDASNRTWNLIRSELKVVRVWDNASIPESSIGKIYSTD